METERGIQVKRWAYMLGEGEVRLKEGPDGPYVFPVIIEQISLQELFEWITR